MKAPLAALLLAACAHAPVRYWSPYGVSHAGDAPPPEETTRAEQDVRRLMVGKYGLSLAKVDEALNAAEVEWVATPWHSWGSCWAGVTDGRHIKVSRAPGAYEHELLHLVGAFFGRPDAEHREAWWKDAPAGPPGCKG